MFYIFGALRQHSEVMGAVLEKPSVPPPTYKEFFGGYNFPEDLWKQNFRLTCSTLDGVMATSCPVLINPQQRSKKSL